MSDRIRQIQLNDALDAYQASLAADGDARAFDLLYRRWHPKLLRLAQRLTRNPDEARDVMQDAALTMARDIRKLKDPARFSAWACTIVRRRTADHIDKAVRRRAGLTGWPDAHDASGASGDVGPESALSLKQALSRLPETERLMLNLVYLDGFRGHEIAAALGIPLGTVKSRLFAARQALKTFYTQGDDHDEL
ncbi:RNA polymerase sigma factor SigK [Algimonas arctica]|uniref:RNA polymerase sigma factor SigK n=1 Tax=Algimonas arctica TaxID=1479486 RepID=A0A8J3G1Q0_9PROT|nr:sigma-70 family RNA polymerase sigma factor [Algimonas arctica]GHA86859.1 RNA polymerase sigma factor SigK [Algimonas arctica]